MTASAVFAKSAWPIVHQKDLGFADQFGSAGQNLQVQPFRIDFHLRRNGQSRRGHNFVQSPQWHFDSSKRIPLRSRQLQKSAAVIGPDNVGRQDSGLVAGAGIDPSEYEVRDRSDPERELSIVPEARPVCSAREENNPLLSG